MEEILYQLISSLFVYPIIYKVSYLSSGDRRISEPSTVSGWWFFATHLKNMLVKLDHFPKDRGENIKHLSCHHQQYVHFPFKIFKPSYHFTPGSPANNDGQVNYCHHKGSKERHLSTVEMADGATKKSPRLPSGMIFLG